MANGYENEDCFTLDLWAKDSLEDFLSLDVWFADRRSMHPCDHNLQYLISAIVGEILQLHELLALSFLLCQKDIHAKVLFCIGSRKVYKSTNPTTVLLNYLKIRGI